MFTKGNLCLLLLAAICFILVACQGVGAKEAIAATGATAAAIVKAVAPLMSDEDAAKLTLIANNIDGTIEATATAVRQVVDAITSVKANATTAIQQVVAQNHQMAVDLASRPTQESVVLTSAGSAAVSGFGINSWRNVTRKRELKALPKAA